jgi:hypothetical protein
MLSRTSALITVVLCLLPQSGYSAEAVPPAPRTPTKKPIVESGVRLPVADENGKLIREILQGPYRLQLDLSEQVIRLDAPREESWRTPEERIRAGDTVIVTDQRAPLQAGTATVAELVKGQLVTVTKVQKEWLATSVLVGGQTKSGWLKMSSVKFHAEEAPLSATLATFAGGEIVSASLLAQKAKQFDDGLYATADVAAQQGAGKFAGKAGLLTRLAEVLAQQPLAPDDARLVVLAAARLGGLPNPSSRGADQAISATVERFQRDPLRSKPLGFYTWNANLRRIFQQDRMLQTRLKGESGVRAIAEALRADGAGLATYEQYLKLISRLTNPLSQGSLRQYLADLEAGRPALSEEGLSFFPPSRSHETDLVMRLYGNQPIPAGFDLMEELIVRIRKGEIDLSPTGESGWYDYQTWALEPLVNPDKTPESVHLKVEETYRKQLLELFKGVLALTRETHVKQLEFPAVAADAPEPDRRPEFYVGPELSVEPLATVYFRRAKAYRFIRAVLEETFGVAALQQQHRLTAAGEVKMTLYDELLDLENLFQGACLTANRQLGRESEISVDDIADPVAAVARFLKWSANLEHDADIGQDARMMVPVFFDQQRQKSKVWVVLGWTGRQVCASFAKAPTIQVFKDDGVRLENRKYDLHFTTNCQRLAYPVMAEVYVHEILDREQFRRHCDTYQTRSAILANLR